MSVSIQTGNVVKIQSGNRVLISAPGPQGPAGSGGGVTNGDKGDITVSSSGEVWTIDNEAVTLGKIQHIGTEHLLGRHASGTGNVQEVGVDGGLQFQGGNLTVDGASITGITAAQVGAIADADTLTNGLVFPSETLGILNPDSPGAQLNLGVFGAGQIDTDRLRFNLNNGDYDIDLSGNLTVAAAATVSGTNTGDITLTGTPDYVALTNQVLTRSLINLGSHVTGTLPVANGGTGATTLTSGALLTGNGTGALQPVTNSSTSSGTITIGAAEALGTTPTTYLTLRNTTAAAAAAQQVSPSFVLEGRGWKTDATAASQVVRFRQNLLPVQGAANPTGTWRLQNEINNSGTWTTSLAVTAAGTISGPSFSSIALASDLLLDNQASNRTIDLRNSAGFTNIVDGGSAGPRLGFSTIASHTSPDLQLSRAAASQLQIGANTAVNSATASAQTIKGPNATGTTATGGSLTIAGGTGTAAGGAVIIAASATTGAPATALTVNNNAVTTFAKPPVMPAYTVATLPSTAANGMVQGAHAIVTDATAPTYLGTLTGGGAIVCPVFYNGTAWVSH